MPFYWIKLIWNNRKGPKRWGFCKVAAAFLHANEKGQPEGQDLHDPELGHSSATTANRKQGPISNSRMASDKEQVLLVNGVCF